MANNTMFGEAKYKYLRDIVTLQNPYAARGAVGELKRLFNGAKTKSKKLRIARATQLASNRARASLKRRGLSRNERQEMWLICGIYDRAAGGMFRILKSYY